MKIFKKIHQKVIDDINCDICKKSTKFDNRILNFATLSAEWGYGSKKDGESHEWHFCEQCYDSITENLALISNESKD